MVEPTRVYFRRDSDFSRVMWFHNNKENEMLIGFYGLSQKKPILKSIFPDRQVTLVDLKALSFSYAAIKSVNKKIDHITVHGDGTFHIKTIGGREIYMDTLKRVEPLGPYTPTFLDFIVLTHTPDKYKMTTTQPKKPSTWIDSQDDRIFIIEGKFAGANYEKLEKEMADRLAFDIGVKGDGTYGSLY